jgi:hypothetical protein
MPWLAGSGLLLCPIRLAPREGNPVATEPQWPRINRWPVFVPFAVVYERVTRPSRENPAAEARRFWSGGRRHYPASLLVTTTAASRSASPPARLAPVMALASNDPSGLRTGRTWSHGRGSRGPAKISRAHGWHGLTSVDSRTDATPDDRTRPILRPTIDHTDSRTCADALRGESQGYLDGVPDGRLAEGMDPRVYSAGPANIKI